MDIGFIGLGHMGQPMARQLLKAGHQLLVYNRTTRRAEELVAEGARLARTVEEAAQAPVAITMLSDDAALEEVVLGPGRLLSAMPKGAIHLSMSTISPALSARLSAEHERAGQQYVAAPVFGRPEAAAAKLNILAAGPAQSIQACRPLLEAMGQQVFELGEEAPHANALKLAGNFLLAAMIENLAEAFSMLRKTGVDPARSLDILTSTLFPAPVYKNYGAQILNRQFEPGFKLPLGLKDVRLVLQTAEAVQTPMPTASLLRDQFLSALARGYQDLDWSALARVVGENAGLKD